MSIDPTSPIPASDSVAVMYLANAFHTIQIQAAVGYVIMFVLTLPLVLYLRFKRHGAYDGDVVAARHVILPTFEPMLWMLLVALGMYSAFLWTTFTFDFIEWLFDAVALAAVYAGRQFIFLLVILYFYQNSVSVQALWRATGMALVLSLFPVILEVVAKVSAIDTMSTYLLQTTFRVGLSIFYLWMLTKPRSRASKWSLRVFCVYFIGAQAIAVTYNELYRQSHAAPELLQVATTFVVVAGYYDTALPLFVWWLLTADTSHWRGLGERACSLQAHMNNGDGSNIIPEITSAQGLHVFIEMHRKFIIDFAHLKVMSRIGRGASADVFRGKLHTKIDVAIKVFTPPEVNEGVVASFSHEAALSGALNHPNIVSFYGLCVCPPTICLVSELCQGSMHDVLAIQQHYQIPQHSALSLCMMLDTARAVEYLHSFSPPFIHRDLKPGNLMVDVNHRIKVTDFGVSKQRTTDVPQRTSLRHMTVVGTVEYMPPEVIRGRGGDMVEAVDIYSLAVTMWDILHPDQDKYVTANQLQIFGLVLQGHRPVLGAHVPRPLQELIQAAWHDVPTSRPAASAIVATLTLLLDDMLGPLADQLSQVVRYAGTSSGPKTTKDSSAHQVFQGEHLVDCMFDLELVHNIPQAIRVGNALMDVGLLHHAKHCQPFENSSALYCFDAVHMEVERPRCQASITATEDSMTNICTTINSASEVAECECAKLAQGFRPIGGSSTPHSLLRMKHRDTGAPLKLKLLDDLTPSSQQYKSHRHVLNV
ncbi:hypothetical protein DYB36_008770 [Aphanomyces astaci]|uniref:TKL protein kinase n=1 Tax=Aphanomyces astaci TaxID=112090 RepID=A0A397B3K4_APHAT|nr:hypothetical protein DYB36_008770 [Aphanomyces astaci]